MSVCIGPSTVSCRLGTMTHSQDGCDAVFSRSECFVWVQGVSVASSLACMTRRADRKSWTPINAEKPHFVGVDRLPDGPLGISDEDAMVFAAKCGESPVARLWETGALSQNRQTKNFGSTSNAKNILTAKIGREHVSKVKECGTRQGSPWVSGGAENAAVMHERCVLHVIVKQLRLLKGRWYIQPVTVSLKRGSVQLPSAVCSRLLMKDHSMTVPVSGLCAILKRRRKEFRSCSSRVIESAGEFQQLTETINESKTPVLYFSQCEANPSEFRWVSWLTVTLKDHLLSEYAAWLCQVSRLQWCSRVYIRSLVKTLVMICSLAPSPAKVAILPVFLKALKQAQSETQDPTICFTCDHTFNVIRWAGYPISAWQNWKTWLFVSCRPVRENIFFAPKRVSKISVS